MNGDMTSSFPALCNYNCRSLTPKINSLIDDFNNRNYQVCFLSEIWQESKKTNKLMIGERIKEVGVKYISTPRRGLKRRGGAAIAWRGKKNSIKKLNIQIPHSLEVT